METITRLEGTIVDKNALIEQIITIMRDTEYII